MPIRSKSPLKSLIGAEAGGGAVSSRLFGAGEGIAGLHPQRLRTTSTGKITQRANICIPLGQLRLTHFAEARAEIRLAE